MRLALTAARISSWVRLYEALRRMHNKALCWQRRTALLSSGIVRCLQMYTTDVAIVAWGWPYTAVLEWILHCLLISCCTLYDFALTISILTSFVIFLSVEIRAPYWPYAKCAHERPTTTIGHVNRTPGAPRRLASEVVRSLRAQPSCVSPHPTFQSNPIQSIREAALRIR